EGEAAEALDQAGAFGQRDEFLGRDGPALRVIPAHQRLAPGDGAGMDVHDRLELYLQLAVPQAAVEVFLVGPGVGGDRAGGGAVGLDAVAAQALGVVHGQLGVAQHVGSGDRVAVIDGDADGSGEREIAVAEIERALQGLADLLGDLGDLSGRLLGGENNAELVAAEAGDAVQWAHDAGDTAGDGEQHGIGGRLAHALLEFHETVDVDEEDGRLDAVGKPGPHQGALQAVEEELPVGQAGQAVVHGVVQQPFARGAILVDVLQRADDAVDLPIAAEHRFHPHAEGAEAAVVGGEANIGGNLAAAQFDEGVEGGAEAVAVVGMDAVKPALDGAAQGTTALAEAGAEFVGNADAVALDVPVEDEVA